MDKINLMPIIEKMMDIFQLLIPIILLAGSAFYGYKVAIQYWVESKANEWMLVIRNGELLKSGIGLATWIMPGDQTIKFPSLINQVKFTAQQVSAEMQGVEVKGMLIWNVHRDKDGPFKCYKSFGEDLQQPVPTVCNEKLESMAVSIIRDRIANLSLESKIFSRIGTS